MPDASPAKWHLAHTTWFFETFVLEPHLRGYHVFQPQFRMLFNSYYNMVGDKHPRPERGLLSRPTLDDVLAYRHHVDQGILTLLAQANQPVDLQPLIELGINHEEQHQELILTDIKHLFSRNPLRPAYQKQWPLTAVAAQRPEWIEFRGGLHEIGRQGTGFSFDHEGPRHTRFVQPFALASQLVTHGDFLSFIDAGGYQQPHLWLSMGWDMVQANGWNAPFYWQRDGSKWSTFSLHGMAPIDPKTPICHVSYFEADAFARWSNARLPTEVEWEIAAGSTVPAGNFVESHALHPLAMRDVPPPTGLAQLFGDVWEWTQSDYAPYPGFRAAPGAVGEYNGKFMCGQYVLRGGSCVTPQRHIRASYRNFFPPHARWQFSGLRLARDL